jgi:hypothetical protein
VTADRPHLGVGHVPHRRNTPDCCGPH